MPNTSCCRPLWFSRFAVILGALLCVAVLGDGFIADLAAQKSAPGPDGKDKASKKKGAEEIDPNPPKLKPPLRFNEDPTRPVEDSPNDLAAEAKNEQYLPEVRELYHRLSVEHDEILFSPPRLAQPVELIPQFIGLKPTFEGKLTVQLLDAKLAATGKTESLTRKQITGVEHYEALAITQVDRFLRTTKDNSKLPRSQALQHAAKVLEAVRQFHDAAREKEELRKGPEWESLGRDLRARLREVRLNRLQALATEKKWDDIRKCGDELVLAYPRDAEVMAAIVKARVLAIEQGLVEKDLDTFVQARQSLQELEQQFPDARKHDAVRDLRERLRKKAEETLAEARKLLKKDRSKASSELKTVDNIWPDLPGARDLRQELLPYKPLVVGVRQLPQYLSPARAATDSERQGVELIFESLLRPVGDPVAGQRYEAVLADGSPRIVPLGRDFQLVHGAHWYSSTRNPPIDEPVTAPDVDQTISLYKKWAGCSPEWAQLLGDPRVEGDAYRIRLTLTQGCIEPLSLMTFKVLPTNYLTSPDDKNFAKAPIGSGPYQYLGTKNDKYAVFMANPTYRDRAGKQGRPYIPAIHFAKHSYQSADVVNDFKKGDLHMLLDLPTSYVKVIEDDPVLKKSVDVYTLRNRRIWFLAVNQADESDAAKYLRNPDLRRALAHAINREEVLNSFFRDERNRGAHRALNGPYPPDSWACDRSLPADPFKPALANTLAKQVHAPELTLLCPEDVYGAGEACEMIKKQAADAGLKIKVERASLSKVHEAVVRDHSYQLAYFYYDFPSDAYWVGPLFDARATGPGGSNFLGPIQDLELEGLLAQVRQHRDFGDVQRLTQQIHQRLYHKTMPFIPLWQLDTHIAVHKDVKTVPSPGALDPLLIFTHVEQWKLAK